MADGMGNMHRSRRLEIGLFEKGWPAPSTGVASLRPYIEPGVEGAQPPLRGHGGMCLSDLTP